ncbi:MAG: YggT family protein [Chloroflexi bacterium]|nr:YggT family protein [Chloroflexota bacterium]
MTTSTQTDAVRRLVLSKVTQFIWWATGLLEGAIGLRVLLKLMAANPNNPFASFVYSLTDIFLWPFVSLTATPSADGIVMEISSLIAMIVYLLLAWGLVELMHLIMSRRG